MPESPEVQALVEELGERIVGRVVREVDVLEFRVVKTRPRPPGELLGARLAAVARHGKHVDLRFDDGRHLVVSLGRHGWARWGGADAATDAPPVLLTIGFDEGPALELTDAGGWVSLGVSVVDDPAEVSAIAKLGPDPADPGYSREDFDRAFAGRRKQTKAVLQEQESIAGIGNAYSDEILFRARRSPVAHAASLSGAELDGLFEATVGEITEAIAARRGIPIGGLKAAKVAEMRVHGRTWQPCPECGGTIRDFAFASTVGQYCPSCQTGGELLPEPSQR
ncbi:DNA-formamidopyrimidine glycosylase family protein [Agromyces mediolanus]|uniref:Formamidopyrimidine-DNA glycosylase n=1 Tax=Agromyces mediolanus TaxID=41986 RepID=A0A918CFV7_AGRME|nr:DNA-formamidopyrimidine glycosylase family protein [Agromyces mediolanus]GGR21745.1 formamidopyrimidine-DNA glycosylase [Agromyces mediolanus]